MRLVLASASTRRAELLRAAGMFFEAMPADVHEAMDPEETPDGYVRRVAQLKAEAVFSRAGGRPVLGADTVVVVDNHVLGKPKDGEQARRMLRILSGRGHMVMTGICLINPAAASGRTQTSVSRTKVEFAALTDEEIDWYVATGEPAEHAGAYAIQGLASRFVKRIEGSYSNVAGLPVESVYDLCRRVGLLILKDAPGGSPRP
jgi:septum formation protein